MKKPITFDSFIRTCTVILGIIFAIMVVDYLSVVLVPFFVAWFVAYLVFPLVEFFQYKCKLRYRTPSIIAALMLVVGTIFLLLLLIIPGITADINQFAKIVDAYMKKENHSTELEQFIAQYINQVGFNKLLNSGQLLDFLKTIMPRIWNVFHHTAVLIVSIVSWGISLLYLVFILYDFDNLADGVYKLVPKKYVPHVNTLFTDLKNGMNAYFRGQFIIAVCVGILYCIGFTIINFPLAIPLGILIGVLSFIPYLHALGLVPAFLLCILKSAETGENFWLITLSAALVFIIVQIIQDAVLTPKIMGKAIGLPPFSILLSLSVWGYLLGIIGMIIALPLTTLLFSYYKRYISKTE